MSEWIELNLPWYATNFYDYKYPEEPDISNEEKEKFGITLKELVSEHFWDKNCYNFTKLQTSYIDKYGEDKGNKKFVSHIQKIKKFKKIKNRLDLLKKIGEYRKNNQKIIEYKNTLQIFEEEKLKEESKLSFCGKALNKPGVLFEIEENGYVKQYLIGSLPPSKVDNDYDINAFDCNLIVKRYKIIWEQK